MYYPRTLVSALILSAISVLVNVLPASAAGSPPRHGALRPIPPYRDASNIQLPPIPDAQIDAHISPALSVTERDIMRNIMQQLLPNKRYNVIYYDLQGTVHANDPRLLQSTKVYKRSALDPRAGIAADGSSVTLPSLQTPGLSASFSCAKPPGSFTGGFRAVYSICNVPYALSYLYLPCKANNQIFYNYPANEAAYMYEGGFSSTGDAVDAGLQHSPTNDNWAIFFTHANSQVGYNPRFQCNQTVPLEFYPISTTLLGVDSTGYTASGYGTVTETLQVALLAGWSPKCYGCVVKRITSLAQRGFLNRDRFDLRGNSGTTSVPGNEKTAV